MIEVVSIKFKNRGKCYFFDPKALKIKTGQRVIVETAKGLEIADCCHGNHMVSETAVVPPLRPIVRIATADDIRIDELNRRREREAFDICQKKIAEHGLDMKLVDVECNFEGNKTLFFFTSDGRVDFRELVKDLAGIFRNRIELRQIGVRDEAKMIGGLGICGRPYCCSQFLDEFQPVSTKMAKVQSLSLNPTKISGSCGRLMCCLRYEEEAYEDLVKHVPKQGAFVETKDGYGTAVQVNLLRQTVKVKLDSDADDALRLYKSNELCAVPGGRPKDGEAPPSVLKYVPPAEDEEEDAPQDDWVMPSLVIADGLNAPARSADAAPAHKQGASRRRGKRGGRGREGAKPDAAQQGARADKGGRGAKNAQSGADAGKATVRPVKVEVRNNSANGAEGGKAPHGAKGGRSSSRRRKYYHGKPKSGGAKGE